MKSLILAIALIALPQLAAAETIHVTNLNDSGAGSLRACAEGSGQRTCVFDVRGTISPRTPINITDDNVHISGPRDGGVSISGGSMGRDITDSALIRIAASNVRVDYLSLTPGDGGLANMQEAKRGIAIRDGSDIIVDHMRIRGGQDSLFEVWPQTDPSENVVLSNSTIEGGRHGAVTGANDQGIAAQTEVTFIGNHFTGNRSRSPFIGTGRTRIINNTIDTWGDEPAIIARGATEIEVTGNTMRRGADSHPSEMEWFTCETDPNATCIAGDPRITLSGNNFNDVRAWNGNDYISMPGGSVTSRATSNARPAVTNARAAPEPTPTPAPECQGATVSERIAFTELSGVDGLNFDCREEDTENSRLLFADEFNGPSGSRPGAPWNFFDAWGSNEWRDAVYSDDYAQMDGNGNLVLSSEIGPDGRLRTSYLQTNQNNVGPGRIRPGTYTEARINMSGCGDVGSSSWCAFWFMSPHAYDGNAENGTEIDIAEYTAANQWSSQRYTTNNHTSLGGGGSEGTWVEGADPSDGFHTYGLDWQPDRLTYYFDDRPVWETTRGVSGSDDQTMILSIENQQGLWDGGTTTNSEPEMSIDYVRVYEGERPE
jgi:pectate lyase